MIKQLINKNQALTLYFTTIVFIFSYFLILFFLKIIGAEELTCQYRGFGSGARQACDAIEYFWDNAFWYILGIMIFQIILIPSTLITYFSNKLIKNKIRTKYKESLWFKYVLSATIYFTSIVILTMIIKNI